MKTTEITNKELRSQVENSIDTIKFAVSPKKLLELGWGFDDAIDFYLEKDENLSQKEAEEKFDEENIIYLYIEKLENGDITTTCEINSMKDHLSNISNGNSESTGDNRGTIKDIEALFFK